MCVCVLLLLLHFGVPASASLLFIWFRFALWTRWRQRVSFARIYFCAATTALSLSHLHSSTRVNTFYFFSRVFSVWTKCTMNCVETHIISISWIVQHNRTAAPTPCTALLAAYRIEPILFIAFDAIQPKIITYLLCPSQMRIFCCCCWVFILFRLHNSYFGAQTQETR